MLQDFIILFSVSPNFHYKETINIVYLIISWRVAKAKKESKAEENETVLIFDDPWHFSATFGSPKQRITFAR